MSHLRLRLLTAVAMLIAFAGFAVGMGAAPAAASTSGVVISEFRARGPLGGNDEFVELRNAGAAPVDISGWLLQGCASGTPGAASTRATVSPGVVLAPGQSYLFANNNAIGGYSGTVAPDQTYGTGITDFATTNFSGVQIVTATGKQDGVGAPNSPCREGTGFVTPTTSGENAFERVGGTQDTENNLADFEGPKTANPQSFGDAAPTVSSTSPTNDATGVALGANVSITFSEAVDVTGSWFTISCVTSGVHSATVSGGPTSFTLDPASDFASNESCTLTVLASGVSDQDSVDPPDAMAADFTAGFATAAGDPCLQSFTPIPTIQGSGATAAVTGQVTTQGVVIGDYEGPHRRSAASTCRMRTVMATLPPRMAASSSTAATPIASIWAISSRYGQGRREPGPDAAFDQAGNIFSCGVGAVQPSDLALPVASPEALEVYEGMLARAPPDAVRHGAFPAWPLRPGRAIFGRTRRPSRPTSLPRAQKQPASGQQPQPPGRR